MKLILELILTVSIFILKQKKHGGKSIIFQQLKKVCWAKTSNQNGDCLGEKKKELLTTMRKIKVIKRVT